ncbi:hypothetical protein BHE74_00044276 [Ensete ventricosum]|nr:hypothetical protein BHE74_00044276 [Ensete ventricosum]RZS13193.1 hypothetical protein BHM03_00044746 [Ensete ventricosum]
MKVICYPSSTLAATSRCYLLPSSPITVVVVSSSFLPLSPAKPQQHTASIDVATSPTAFPAFCPMFHDALFLPLLSVVIFQPPSLAIIATLSLDRIIILPKRGLLSATFIPPLLICHRPAFGNALLLPPLPSADHHYPSPACYRSEPVPLPSLFLPFLPYRHRLATGVVASPASLALSRVFLPLHLPLSLSDPVLPNLFPTTAAIAGHNRYPSPISSFLATSPLLPALTAATCR